MRKRIGNDIRFTWHVNRRVDGALVPESFIGKDVAVELIAPSHRAAEITDVRTAAGVVTFTFPGKNQTEFGVYTAVLYENRGNDGMVAIDTVEAVTLVRHSFQESNEGSDVIEASSVEIDSELSASAGSSTEPVQADWQQTDDMALDYIKNKPDIEGLLEGKYDKEDGVRFGDKAIIVEKLAGHIPSEATEIYPAMIDFYDMFQEKGRNGTIWFNGGYMRLIDEYRKSGTGKIIATLDEVQQRYLKPDAGIPASDLSESIQNTLVEVSGKDSKTSIEAIASGTTAIVATEHKYYVVQGTVGNLAVTLPTPEDPTKVQSIAFYFTTGANPSVTFSHASTVYYYDGYAIEASKTYEINALWNGTNWIIAYGKIG